MKARKHIKNLGMSRFKSDPPILTIPIGIVGSGKTFNAPENHLRVSKDALRSGLYNTEITLVDYESEGEDIIETFQGYIFVYLKTLRFNIYLDSTNLERKKRLYFVHLAHEEGYKIRYFVFDDFDRAREYNHNRERIVSDDIINDMIKRFEYPSNKEISDYSIEVIKK